jgi:hypothetical protein
VGSQQIEIAFELAHALATLAKPRRLGRAVTEMVFRIDPATNLQRRPDAAFISDARWPFRKRVPDVPVWDMGGRAGHWLSLTPVPSQSEQGHPEAVTATADASVDPTGACATRLHAHSVMVGISIHRCRCICVS